MQKLFSSNRNLARFYLVVTSAPLVAALVSQYFFGLHPCELCIYQRIPYAVMIFFCLLAYFKPVNKSLITMLVITIHAFLINSGIAFYHVGVEKNWWVHGDCAGNFDMTSVETLKASLFAAPAVKCADIQFEFLGVSMAGWNFVYCLTMGFASIFIFIKYFKHKKSLINAQG